MKTLGFIGVGNMAGAMIGGLLRSGQAQPSDIIGSCKTRGGAERAAQRFGIEVTNDNREVARNCRILFLAVKPQFLDAVLDQIRDVVTQDQMVAPSPDPAADQYARTGGRRHDGGLQQ